MRRQPEATLEAARAFLSDMFGYEADGSAGTAKELTVGDGRTFRGEYPQTALTLGGVPIEEYTVVVSRDSTAARIRPPVRFAAVSKSSPAER